MEPWEEWLNWAMTVFGVILLMAVLISVASLPFALLGACFVSMINFTGLNVPFTFISSALVGASISYIIYRIVTR